jgi:hypothetical protein
LIGGTLDVAGAATFEAGATINGGLTDTFVVNIPSSFTSLSLSGTLDVVGLTTVDEFSAGAMDGTSLITTGNITSGGTLGVAGVASLNGGATTTTLDVGTINVGVGGYSITSTNIGTALAPVATGFIDSLTSITVITDTVQAPANGQVSMPDGLITDVAGTVTTSALEALGGAAGISGVWTAAPGFEIANGGTLSGAWTLSEGSILTVNGALE